LPDAILLLDIIILWVHLFSAVVFVGGSFFMWLVVVPASRLITSDESQRTAIVGKIAKAFGKTATILLIVLVATGVFNASWYLPSMQALFDSYTGMILLVKIVLVATLIALIYVHNLYFGKRILRLAEEKKLEELQALRKQSRIVSATNLILMVAILVLATLLQMPP
jgi:uncharacterized membrane protein